MVGLVADWFLLGLVGPWSYRDLALGMTWWTGGGMATHASLDFVVFCS